MTNLLALPSSGTHDPETSISCRECLIRKFLYCRPLLFCFLLILGLAEAAPCDTLDFEGFDDQTILTNQYPGVVFGNTWILKQFYTLNEGDFPPRSGDNVASSLNNTYISVTFSEPVVSIEAYVTYSQSVDMLAFDASLTQIAKDTSLFNNNTAVSGDAGSSPNEFFIVTGNGIRQVLFIASAAPGQFTIDDLKFVAVPEPATVVLVGLGLPLVALLRSVGRR